MTSPTPEAEIQRRKFLSQLGLFSAAAGLAVSSRELAADDANGAGPPLPAIQLGSLAVSRLMAGWNPIGGYSYMGPHTDRHMKEYFTVEQTVRFLLDCEKAGVNAHQFSSAATTTEVLRRVREQGSQMHFFGLHAGREGVAQIIHDTQPFALVHHGGVTDKLFREGKSQEVRDYVKAVKDAGLLAGVSAHNPDCIRQVAEEGWEVDFYMCCFYYLTRPHGAGEHAVPVPETLQIAYPFYRTDPETMTRVMREVPQPCLGFKILGAGRLCESPEMVREAFRFAFQSIKPTDGVIVGMYPRFEDEISANAQHTRELSQALAGS
jgi:hypothetical protein